jgi:hypothetical protein
MAGAETTTYEAVVHELPASGPGGCGHEGEPAKAFVVGAG